MNYVEEKLPYESFIGGWHIDTKMCDDIINYHKSNIELHYQGRQGGTVDKNIKDSTDVSIDLGKQFKYRELFTNYADTLYELIKLYEKKYIDYNLCSSYGIREPFVIQHYKPGGGFKEWHSERTEHRNRNLVFMTYLNEVPNAGTEFKYQKVKTECKKGLTLIWPTDPTHTHRGIVNHKKDKYIITGWFGYFGEEYND